MPYTISVPPGEDYVLVTVTGEITRDLAFEHVTAANARASETGIRCFLFDIVEARNVESVLGNFKMTHADSRLVPASYRESCVAVLVHPDDDSHDFNEVLAQNAGMDLMLFRERDKALKHLAEAAERFAEGG